MIRKTDEDASAGPAWLSRYAENFHSQNGEDGIIARILDAIGRRDRWCVEFGAWDGVRFSNTRRLVASYGYRAVLIEADRRRFQELARNAAAWPRAIPLHRRVGFGAADRLDAILAETECPRDFDLLSVDIDGNDYHAWAAVAAYRPKVVCIEFNPTIPHEVDFVQPADRAATQGASLAALVRLGRAKRYELAAVAGANALFVDAAYFGRFGIDNRDLARLRPDAPRPVYLFTGFDGRVLTSGPIVLPWHGLAYGAADLQVLPRGLRAYPGRYGALRRRLLGLYGRYRRLRHGPGAAP